MQIPFPGGILAVFSALSGLWRVLRVANNFWLPLCTIQDMHTFALVLLKEPTRLQSTYPERFEV